MAADSLLGGNSASIIQSLSAEAKSILDSLLADTISNSTSAPTTTQLTGATLVSGTGANAEAQAALVATSAFSGAVSFGSLNVNVEVPANVVVTAEGPSAAVNATAAANYFTSLINAALPSASGSSATLKASLEKATEIVTTGVTGTAAVKVMQVSDSTTSTGNQVKLVGNTASTEVLAINVASLSADKTLVIENMDRAVIVGAGKVEVSGSTSSLVVGDSSNQSMTGGAGADTIVGGGGSDTLAGGLGADKFGIAGGGNYVISDLSLTQGDKIAFSFAGLTDINQLAAAVTSVSQTSTGLTYNFGGSGSITLVGVSPAAITADLLQFSI